MSQSTNTPQKTTKVVTGKARFSYVNVFQPRAATDGAVAKYGVTLLIPKSDTATVKAIAAAIDAAATAGIGKFGGKIPPGLKKPVHDGDGLKPSGDEYPPEAAGCWVINCSSLQRPKIVDTNLLDILDSADFYSGCYGRASINFFAYRASGNQGIGCGLNNLQKLADGEPLGNISTPEADFGIGDLNEPDPFA